jgi:NTE family protein
MSKALVLSGGGSVGIAWQTGLAAGLARRGVDLTEAGFILGTSAGSAVGAQLALGSDLEERVARYREVAAGPGPAETAVGGSGESTATRMARFMKLMADTMDAEPEERRATIGRFALEADALAEDQFVAAFRYLKGEPWPERYACTAVDAENGEFKVWDDAAHVELDRAVASSCAVPGLFSPITIDGRRYMDGGMRSGTNADLAVGHDAVLVISLMTANRLPAGDPRVTRLFQTMENESAVLTDAGAQVKVVGPDPGASEVMGMNLMDGSIAPAAAFEGVRQGEAIAGDLAKFWA